MFQLELSHSGLYEPTSLTHRYNTRERDWKIAEETGVSGGLWDQSKAELKHSHTPSNYHTRMSRKHCLLAARATVHRSNSNKWGNITFLTFRFPLRVTPFTLCKRLLIHCYSKSIKQCSSRVQQIPNRFQVVGFRFQSHFTFWVMFSLAFVIPWNLEKYLNVPYKRGG